MDHGEDLLYDAISKFLKLCNFTEHPIFLAIF